MSVKYKYRIFEPKVKSSIQFENKICYKQSSFTPNYVKGKIKGLVTNPKTELLTSTSPLLDSRAFALIQSR